LNQITEEKQLNPTLAYLVRKQSLVVPVIAVLVAFTIGAVLIYFQGVNPLSAYKTIFQSALGTERGLQRTLEKTTPLILAGLAVAVALRVGLFNIGAQGQLIMGAFFATWAGFTFTNLPALMHIFVGLLAGITAGAIWAGIAGVLKAYRGVHEVISTIMLNSIAIALLDYLVNYRFKEPDQALPRTVPILESAKLPQLGFVPLGFLLALAVALFISWLINRTTTGFRLNTVGTNKFAAAYAGIKIKYVVVGGMLLSGGLAGLGGAIETLGITHRFEPAFNKGLGFDGITIALLARANPIATIPAAFLVGVLRSGAPTLQFDTGLEPEIVDLLLALTLLFVAAPILGKLIFRKRAEKTQNVSSGWGS
jgi:general nucleoside transport system permease protein